MSLDSGFVLLVAIFLSRSRYPVFATDREMAVYQRIATPRFISSGVTILGYYNIMSPSLGLWRRHDTAREEIRAHARNYSIALPQGKAVDR